ncbi:MAG: hypothetical protein A2428_03235 [Bdellovibrionales bacterium RIFOXYC1_FULL_54_43]|nr:MAG: hypothetical protein A2428_03235 [Bdellovibrionales bacterium RIFOXYC1_FULL_54_43]OFZ82695.1 MAG: hypothetical protein A2603_02670 [Bdellovibrionales bacterium RIFOXYD1_FULL_55_31]
MFKNSELSETAGAARVEIVKSPGKTEPSAGTPADLRGAIENGLRAYSDDLGCGCKECEILIDTILRHINDRIRNSLCKFSLSASPIEADIAMEICSELVGEQSCLAPKELKHA